MNVSNQDNLQNQEQQEQQSLPSNSIESDNSPERIDETDENMARSVHSFTRNTPTRKDFKKFYFSRSFSTKTYKDKARCNALSFTFNDMDQVSTIVFLLRSLCNNHLFFFSIRSLYQIKITRKLKFLQLKVN